MVCNSRSQITLDLLFVILVLVSFFVTLQTFSDEFLSSNENISYDYEFRNVARSTVSFLTETSSLYSNDSVSASYFPKPVFVEGYSSKFYPIIGVNLTTGFVTISAQGTTFSVSEPIPPAVVTNLGSFSITYSNNELVVSK